MRHHKYMQLSSNMEEGPTGARTPGVLPRSRKQIHDINAYAKKNSDPVDDLLEYVRLKEERLVLRHQDMPSDLWVLGTDTMDMIWRNSLLMKCCAIQCPLTRHLTRDSLK